MLVSLSFSYSHPILHPQPPLNLQAQASPDRRNGAGIEDCSPSRAALFASKPAGKDNVIMNLPFELIPTRIANSSRWIPCPQANPRQPSHCGFFRMADSLY
jgi:hypothetical protein